MTKKKGRREFLKETGMAAGALTVIGTAQLLSSCEHYIAHDYAKGIDIEIDVNSVEYRRYLTRIGGGLIKLFHGINNGVPVIIVKATETTYKCYSSMCTHNNCYARESYHSRDPEEKDKSDVRPPLGYEEPTEDNPHPSPQSIVCFCHGSRFDPFDEGKPYQGPAERPLTQYKCEFNSDNGILTIHF